MYYNVKIKPLSSKINNIVVTFSGDVFDCRPTRYRILFWGDVLRYFRVRVDELREHPAHADLDLDWSISHPTRWTVPVAAPDTEKLLKTLRQTIANIRPNAREK